MEGKVNLRKIYYKRNFSQNQTFFHNYIKYLVYYKLSLFFFNIFLYAVSAP